MISKYEIEQASKIVESERKLKSEIAIKDATIKNYKISNENIKAEIEELKEENASMEVSAGNSWAEYCSSVKKINTLEKEIAELKYRFGEL